MATQDTAIRKRQQIANANQMMFIWVAAVSMVVGFAIVASIFLLQKAWFNERVLSEKSNTASTLVKNNEVIDDLKDEMRVLNTNEALKSSMAAGETQPIQVVLDALPSDANSSAFGSSLQEKFLNDSALRVEALNVDPVVGIESKEDTNVQDASAGQVGGNEISFHFSVSVASANASALKNLLKKLESSIRAIDLTTLSIETQGNRLVMMADGRAYYEPAKTVELKDKTVKS